MIRQHLQAGYTLAEMILALLINSLVLLGASRMLVNLTLQQTAFQQRQQLLTQTDYLLLSLEKAIRRAGYCYGENCQGSGLKIQDQGRCVLLAWDENHNGRWEAPGHPASEFFAFRYSHQAIQTRRGATDCQGTAWEHLTDPDHLVVEQFSASEQQGSVIIRLAIRSGKHLLTRTHWIVRRNRR